MSRRIDIPQRIIQTIRIPIERLRIHWPQRDIVLLAGLAIPLEERAKLQYLAVFRVDLRRKLAQVHRERGQAGVAVVAQGGCAAAGAAGCAGHNRIGAEEPA